MKHYGRICVPDPRIIFFVESKVNIGFEPKEFVRDIQ